jgi:hypothetical protein
MQQQIDAPTPQALADLVERCRQIDRFSTTLAAAEETRIAALAAGIVAMRKVLELDAVPASKLPVRQSRIAHWALIADHLDDARTEAIDRVAGLLVLDEHGQVKLLSDRSWRGQWRQVVLWRNGVNDLSAEDLLEYLAKLTALAQRRAPKVARSLLERSLALQATSALLSRAD